MKTLLRSLVFAMLVLALPRGAFAGDGFWDFIEGFSGPGPFQGFTINERLFCVKEKAVPQTFGVANCLVNPLRDDKIRSYVTGEFGWYTSGDNPRFADTPRDIRTVHLVRIHSDYMYRLHAVLDIGAGGGLMVFTGDGFDSQTHFVVTPVSVIFTPLGFTGGKWGRLVRANFSESWVVGDISAADFNSPSSYVKHGELNRKFGIGIDFGVFFSK